MEQSSFFALLNGQATPFSQTSPRAVAGPTPHHREGSSDDDNADVPVAVAVTATSPLRSLHDARASAQLSARGPGRPVTVPPPLGSTTVAAAEREDTSGDVEVSAAIAVPHDMTAADTSGAAVRLSHSPVDVPPGAIPASRFKNLYDGSFYLPPGTTKRALGRLKLLWCCVLTQESWHASFVAGPIFFFSVLFVTCVVPAGEWFSYVFTFVFAAASLTCLTLCVAMDPGIIPPAPLSEMPRGPVMMMVDGRMVECKVCRTCHIVRPPRSSHCKFCDVCVDEFDHHCGILGSCVAKRTFRFFGGFFMITTVLALYVLIRSFVVVVNTDFKAANDDKSLLAVAAGSVVCILAAIIGGVMVMPCAVRYIMLSAKNETTKETMRREEQTEQQQQPRQQRGPNEIPGCVPVEEIRSENYCLNFVRRFFAPVGRSRIPFDYYV